MSVRYLQPQQALEREPTLYEDLLGDALERAFAKGAHDLASLVEQLNREGIATPDGHAWTAENYSDAIAVLAQ
ncbi:recombinase-like helix-turn-helix domain-containing protein [Alcaligenes parafaecalis]|uniref:Recombinase-like domain-containing protein n=1 Tax=Alcaligenes parafaecalis TaxID=171260 RepID=A0ABT3VQK7_9BURK|nr:recombinase-like helix-turn-helix domain-containing protein [Alcaligenes parafaecalis]MCX5465342.1 hypothetical protein [Alcaligenes parafaecalis]